MTTDLLNIGQAAAAAGVSAKMVRHYEQIGLLPPAQRNAAGYRLYSERDVSVLRFIHQSRRLGFPVAQIAELIGLWSDSRRSSREVKAVAQRHLDDLQAKLDELGQMQQALQALVRACQGDEQPHCAILETLTHQAQAEHAPLQKPRLRKARASGGAALAPGGGGGGGHIDLMAWMRGVHVHHG